MFIPTHTESFHHNKNSTQLCISQWVRKLFGKLDFHFSLTVPPKKRHPFRNCNHLLFLPSITTVACCSPRSPQLRLFSKKIRLTNFPFSRFAPGYTEHLLNFIRLYQLPSLFTGLPPTRVVSWCFGIL